MTRHAVRMLPLLFLAGLGTLARPAQARDLTGRWGLGVSSAFSPGGYLGNGGPTLVGLLVPGISAKYAVNERTVINPGLGVLYYSKAAPDPDSMADTRSFYTIGGRVLQTMLSEANTNFYIGGGIVLTLKSFSDPATGDPGKLIRVPLIFGVEHFFSKASSFAVAAEAGLEVSYNMPDEGPKTLTAGTAGGVFTVGFHYYFSGGGGGDEGEGS